jgi:hypothetical protein
MNQAAIDYTQSTRLAHVAAAWEVWSERQHEIRRLVRMSEWSGDLPDAAQVRDLRRQHEAQLREAYARARVQIAIVQGVDGVDQASDYEAHWRETWGDVSARIAADWKVDFAGALERQTKARAEAQVQRTALAEVP